MAATESTQDILKGIYGVLLTLTKKKSGGEMGGATSSNLTTGEPKKETLKSKADGVSSAVGVVKQLASLSVKDLVKAKLMVKEVNKIISRLVFNLLNMQKMDKGQIKTIEVVTNSIKMLFDMLTKTNMLKLALHCKMFPEKALLGVIDSIKKIMWKITLITDVKHHERNIRRIVNILNDLVGMVKSLAIWGVIGPLVLIPAMIGLGVVIITITAIVAVCQLVHAVSLLRRPMKRGIRRIMLLLAGLFMIPITMTIVGIALAAIGLPVMLLGLGLVIVSVLAIALTAFYILGVSKVVKRTTLPILHILKFIGMASLIPLATILIASLMLGLTSEYGFASTLAALIFSALMITASIFAIFGIIKLTNKVAKQLNSRVFTSVGEMSGFVIAAGLIPITALAVGYIIMKAGDKMGAGSTIAALGIGFGAMMASLGFLYVMIKLVGRLDRNAVIKGTVIVGLSAILLLVLGKMMNNFADVTNKIEATCGWLKLIASMGLAMLAVTAFTLLMAGVGAMCANPFIAAALTYGGVIVGAASLILLTLSNALLTFATAVEKIDSLGNPEEAVTRGMKLLNNFFLSTMSIISTIGTKIGITDIIKARLIMAPISDMIDAMSKFVDVLAKFGGNSEEGKFRLIVGYDRHGNAIYGEEVDIVAVGEALGTSFGLFANKLMTKLKETPFDMTAGWIGEQLKIIMDPVNSFVTMIAEQDWDENGNMVKYEYDENGKKKGQGKIIDLVKVGDNIANAFNTFSQSILSKLSEGEKAKRKVRKKIEAMANIMEPISKFVETVVKVSEISDATNLVTLTDNITTSMARLLETGLGFDSAKAMLYVKNAETFGYIIDRVDNSWNKLESHQEEVMQKVIDKQQEFMDMMATTIDKSLSSFEKYANALARIVRSQEQLLKQAGKIGAKQVTFSMEYTQNKYTGGDGGGGGGSKIDYDELSTAIANNIGEVLSNMSIQGITFTEDKEGLNINTTHYALNIDGGSVSVKKGKDNIGKIKDKDVKVETEGDFKIEK